MGKPGQILMVDQDPGEAAKLQSFLLRAGIIDPCQVVPTFMDALDYMKGAGAFQDRRLHPLPTVMFLSMELNGFLGYKLMEWVRNQPSTKNCSIVVCSSLKGALDLSKCYKLGARTFLLKPYRLDEIQNMVKHFPNLLNLAVGEEMYRGLKQQKVA